MSYTHFTLNERKYLQKLLEEGKSIREISRTLERSPSSVSREIKRNSSKKGYHHWRANTLSIMRKRYQHHKRTLEKGSFEWEYIVSKLNLFWSPEEIVGRFELKYGRKPCAVSTIYRYIYRCEFPDIRRKTHLRRRGKKRQTKDANYNTIHPDRIIPQWPDIIKNRMRIGDWEGDTVYGSPGKGSIATSVDRKTRFLLTHLLPSRKADVTREAFAEMHRNVPVHSLSLDNGSEFSEFKELESQIGAPIWFAEPHKPWQRGTNENTNDIIRFFFPKGCDFTSVSPDYLAFVTLLINTRPRKSLNWLSPFELFFGVALD